jgi:hypothetical protein
MTSSVVQINSPSEATCDVNEKHLLNHVLNVLNHNLYTCMLVLVSQTPWGIRLSAMLFLTSRVL